MQISDEFLWKSCLAGDKRAFEELYCRFYSLLCNYGFKLVTDKDMVKDCIQDIFIKLFQNHHSLSETPNVKGYLLKALRNKLFDAIEKEKETDDISLYHETFYTDDLMNQIVFEENEADLHSRDLMAAFNELSFRQQEIICLYYINDLNHETIAEVMGINYQSSKNLLYRSLSKLRELYLKNN